MLPAVSIEVTGTAVVTRKGLRRARRGWPWLMKDDIVSYEGDHGPFVDLVDETSLPMGTALYDPNGKAPIRLLSSARTRDPVTLLQARIERALLRRETDLEGADGGRIVHAEADGVPGLYIDRFGTSLLITIDAAPMHLVVEMLLPFLIDRSGAQVIGIARGDTMNLVRGSDSKVRFVHGRLEVAVDLASPGTRLLTKELERQRALRRWARGRCLDLFAGWGGYGLQMAEAGAREVVVVDEPPHLSTSIEDDARHNDIQVRMIRTEDEPLTWLRAQTEGHARFDVVVFHPEAIDDEPDTALPRAIEHAGMCMRLLDEGGILAASPMSSSLTDAQFAEALQDAAAKFRKRLQILARLGNGPDHPVLAGAPIPPSMLVARVLATA
jgi:23S rRNA (cytosine1962-C5)-methyltransferase